MLSLTGHSHAACMQQCITSPAQDWLPVNIFGRSPSRCIMQLFVYFCNGTVVSCSSVQENSSWVAHRSQLDAQATFRSLEYKLNSRWGFGWVDKAQCFRSARRFGAAGSSPDFSRGFSQHGAPRPSSWTFFQCTLLSYPGQPSYSHNSITLSANSRHNKGAFEWSEASFEHFAVSVADA